MPFITARKRSLGQGNVFILVCQSFCSQGTGSLYDVISCLAAWSHVPSGGISVYGPMFLLGVSISGPMFLPGVSVQEGSPLQRPPGQRPPLDRDPPDRDPPGQRPLLDRNALYSKEHEVRILLECILVLSSLLLHPETELLELLRRIWLY